MRATQGIDAVVVEPRRRGHNVRPRGYGENFATDRRGAVDPLTAGGGQPCSMTPQAIRSPASPQGWVE